MEWLWSEAVWCPPNLKWSDFRPDSAQIHHLYYSLLTAGVLIVLRYFTEILLFRPLGRLLCCSQSIENNNSSGINVGKTGGGDMKKVKRNNVAKRSTVYKFSEGMWRLTFYLFASLYGWFVVLWDKPYFKDTMHSLYNYPHHPVQTEEWWYYNIELAFYISLVITQFIDTRRKDFWQMFLHHIVTILLLVLSWACNFHRIGALVLAIHDIADVPLEGAKLAKYCKRQRLADLLFAIFTVTWIYTRCYLLPTRVIYYTTYEALSIIPFFPAYYIFNGLLCILQVLHLVWTWIIMRMVVDALLNSGMRDLRSDSEDSVESHND